MSTRTRLVAIAIALLASGSPAFAQHMQSRPDDATPCATSACEGDVEALREPPGERTLSAEVVSIDESAGRVVLDTEIGVVTVRAAPATIGQLSVGDVVMLRVVPEADDAPSASPPTEDDTNAPRRL